MDLLSKQKHFGCVVRADYKIEKVTLLHKMKRSKEEENNNCGRWIGSEILISAEV